MLALELVLIAKAVGAVEEEALLERRGQGVLTCELLRVVHASELQQLNGTVDRMLGAAVAVVFFELAESLLRVCMLSGVRKRVCKPRKRFVITRVSAPPCSEELSGASVIAALQKGFHAGKLTLRRLRRVASPLRERCLGRGVARR